MRCEPYGIIHSIDPRPTRKIGIDPLDFCRILELNKTKTPRIIAAGEDLSFPGQLIDIAVCFNIPGHVISPEKVVAETSRMLRKDGRPLLWLHTIKPLIKRLISYLSCLTISPSLLLPNRGN